MKPASIQGKVNHRRTLIIAALALIVLLGLSGAFLHRHLARRIVPALVAAQRPVATAPSLPRSQRVEPVPSATPAHMPPPRPVPAEPWIERCKQLAQSLTANDASSAERAWGQLVQMPLPHPATIEDILGRLDADVDRFVAIAGWVCSHRGDQTRTSLAHAAPWVREEGLRLCGAMMPHPDLRGRIARNALARLGGVLAARMLILDVLQAAAGDAGETTRWARVKDVQPEDVVLAVRGIYSAQAASLARQQLVGLLARMHMVASADLLLELSSMEGQDGLELDLLLSAGRMVPQLSDATERSEFIDRYVAHVRKHYLNDPGISRIQIGLRALAMLEARWARDALASLLVEPSERTTRQMIVAAMVRNPSPEDGTVLDDFAGHQDPDVVLHAANTRCQQVQTGKPGDAEISRLAERWVPAIQRLLAGRLTQEQKSLAYATLGMLRHRDSAGCLLAEAAKIETHDRLAQELEQAMLRACTEESAADIQRCLDAGPPDVAKALLTRVLQRVSR